MLHGALAGLGLFFNLGLYWNGLTHPPKINLGLFWTWDYALKKLWNKLNMKNIGTKSIDMSDIRVYLAMFSTTNDKMLCFIGPHKMKRSHYFSVEWSNVSGFFSYHAIQILELQLDFSIFLQNITK